MTFEPERYELREVTLHIGPQTTRREFLGVLGGGVVVVVIARRPAFAWTRDGRPEEYPEGAEEIGAWLSIDAAGLVTAYTGKVEIGQGIRTSLAQEVAQELRVAPSSVRLVMGDTDLTPFDQGTFGSRSTPQMGTQLRKAGAAARDVLTGLAAKEWGIDASTLAAADGQITDPKSGNQLSYGKLAGGKRLTQAIRDDVPLTPADHWTVAGMADPKVGADDIVRGRHAYAADVAPQGVLYGKVLRPPFVGALPETVDPSGVTTVPGATLVRDGEFIAVTAPRSATAQRALDTIKVTWPAYPGPGVTSDDVFDYLRRAAPGAAVAGGEGSSRRDSHEVGDVTAALASAAHRLTRSYTAAYIAHVPLEPRAAVAQWSKAPDGDRVTVWTGTQRPFAVRDQVAGAFGLKAEAVRVIVPDTGSAYGGKHTGECAVEAARMARAAGAPVKLVWTREEEFRWAYFRPAAVIDVDAGVTGDGLITAWAFDNYNSGSAAIRPQYAIPNQRITFHPSDSPLRQGSYRGLAATANHFARELHVSELADVLKMDPLALRLANTPDPRLKAVFTAAAERFGWGKAVPAGHGVGIAGGFEKGGYIATCADVTVTPADGVRITRAVTAFDCGAVVNPDGLKNQVQGALIQGIGGALFEAIHFDRGVIKNPHLAQYRVPRFPDVPAIDVVLVNRPDQPSMGAGETPIMALAPAVAAGIHQVTGEWRRSLPLDHLTGR